MRLIFNGIPGNEKENYYLSEEQSSGILGRMQGSSSEGLAIAIPHLVKGAASRATVNWSRHHAQFDWDGRDWTIRVLGSQPTMVNGIVVQRNKAVKLRPQNVLECDGIRLHIDHDSFGTGVVDAGEHDFQTGEVSAEHWKQGRKVRIKNAIPTLVPQLQKEGGAPESTLTLRRDVDEAKGAATRARMHAKTAQARRATAEQARDKAERLALEIRDLEATAARATVQAASAASAAAQAASEQAESAADSARAAAAQARDKANAVTNSAAGSASTADEVPARPGPEGQYESRLPGARDFITQAEAAAEEAAEQAQVAAAASESARTAAESAGESARSAAAAVARLLAAQSRSTQSHAQLRVYAIAGLFLLLASVFGITIGALWAF